jgi:hypothetical protein
MTNYLTTAVASNGSACFLAVLEIEKEMSDAQEKTLQASNQTVDLVPNLVQGQLNATNAQADNQASSSLFAAAGQIAQGVTALGCAFYGEKFAGNNAYEDEMSSGNNQMRVTAEEEKAPTQITENDGATATVTARNDGTSAAPTERSGTARVEAATENTQEQAEVDTKKTMTKKAGQKNQTDEEKAETLKERAQQARLSAINKWCNTYAGNVAPMTSSGFGIGKGNVDASSTQNGGLATAAGQVVQTNQSAVSSQSALTQAYEKGFDSAASTLASIIGNLRG